MISAFRHKPHENRALLSCLSASSGNSLPTWGFLVSWLLKMEPIGCPEPSVRNYRYALHDSSELCSSRATRPFIHSIGMCRMRQFLAVLRIFFHSSLLHNFSCHSSPPTILLSSLTSSCYLFLGLVVSKFI
jgi:hypothetical protein